MSSIMKPWAFGTFELLVHAEMHWREDGDFDRRIALIGFDNAIEVAITTYLSLDKIQRDNRDYSKADVGKWLGNYHTKIDFFLTEIGNRKLQVVCDKAEIVWYHGVRNGQYHGGVATIPQELELDGIRKAAFWVFSVLFDVQDVSRVIDSEIADRTQSALPKRSEATDKLIDMTYEPVILAGQPYKVSEALCATDPDAYQGITAAISESRNIIDELSKKYPGFVRPDITEIRFVHYEEAVYLKVVDGNGDVTLTDTEYIGGDKSEGQYFSPSHTSEYNADLLLNKFDPYSIINCFSIFTEQAALKITKEEEVRR